MAIREPTDRARVSELPDTEMTDRQVAFAVRFGRKATITCTALGESYDVYFCGMDDLMLRVSQVVGSDREGYAVDTFMLSRSVIDKIQVHTATTLNKEPVARELDQIIKPFRRFVLEEFFPDRPR